MTARVDREPQRCDGPGCHNLLIPRYRPTTSKARAYCGKGCENRTYRQLERNFRALFGEYVNRPASARRDSQAGVAWIPLLLAGAAGVSLLGGDIWGPIKALAESFAPIAQAVVDMLPDAADLGLEIPDGFVLGYTMLNAFLPLSEALSFVAVLAGIAIAGITWRIAVTVYHLIPKPGMGT